MSEYIGQFYTTDFYHFLADGAAKVPHLGISGYQAALVEDHYFSREPGQRFVEPGFSPQTTVTASYKEQRKLDAEVKERFISLMSECSELEGDHTKLFQFTDGRKAGDIRRLKELDVKSANCVFRNLASLLSAADAHNRSELRKLDLSSGSASNSVHKAQATISAKWQKDVSLADLTNPFRLAFIQRDLADFVAEHAFAPVRYLTSEALEQRLFHAAELALQKTPYEIKAYQNYAQGPGGSLAKAERIVKQIITATAKGRFRCVTAFDVLAQLHIIWQASPYAANPDSFPEFVRHLVQHCFNEDEHAGMHKACMNRQAFLWAVYSWAKDSLDLALQRERSDTPSERECGPILSRPGHPLPSRFYYCLQVFMEALIQTGYRTSQLKGLGFEADLLRFPQFISADTSKAKMERMDFLDCVPLLLQASRLFYHAINSTWPLGIPPERLERELNTLSEALMTLENLETRASQSSTVKYNLQRIRKDLTGWLKTLADQMERGSTLRSSLEIMADPTLNPQSTGCSFSVSLIPPPKPKVASGTLRTALAPDISKLTRDEKKKKASQDYEVIISRTPSSPTFPSTAPSTRARSAAATLTIPASPPAGRQEYGEQLALRLEAQAQLPEPESSEKKSKKNFQGLDEVFLVSPPDELTLDGDYLLLNQETGRPSAIRLSSEKQARVTEALKGICHHPNDLSTLSRLMTSQGIHALITMIGEFAQPRLKETFFKEITLGGSFSRSGRTDLVKLEAVTKPPRSYRLTLQCLEGSDQVSATTARTVFKAQFLVTLSNPRDKGKNARIQPEGRPSGLCVEEYIDGTKDTTSPEGSSEPPLFH